MTETAPNPLAAYLASEKISDTEFAAKIGRDRSIVYRIKKNDLTPTLAVAAAIEEHTGGAVPMQAWTDLPQRAAA